MQLLRRSREPAYDKGYDVEDYRDDAKYLTRPILAGEAEIVAKPAQEDPGELDRDALEDEGPDHCAVF